MIGSSAFNNEVNRPGMDIFHCTEQRLPLQISRWRSCNRNQLCERTKPIPTATDTTICANSTDSLLGHFTTQTFHISHTTHYRSSFIITPKLEIVVLGILSWTSVIDARAQWKLLAYWRESARRPSKTRYEATGRYGQSTN